ncbi:MAG TPA: TCR/Tet family MFS transporter [Gemmatimonadaceae bacterium]|nr:TCR/Tet family MFS transporter [Gemmatimonadaceae bacterium]
MSLAPRRNAIVFIAVTLLLDTIGFGLIIPVLPNLLVQITHESVSRAAVYGGWLAFTYAVVQFFCAPVLGGLSDRFGRRPVLLYAIGSLGIDYIVMGLAPTLGWLFLGRMISGAAGATFSPAYAYVADITPPEKRAQSFGIVSAMFGVGFIAGPAIGGLLGGLGVRAPFFVAAAVSLVNFIYGVFVLPESLPPERRRRFEWRRANPLGTLMQMRRHPVVFGLLTALFIYMVAHQVMPTTWSFYTTYRFNWSSAMIGGSLAITGLMSALSQATLLRYLVPRMGERGAALMAMTVMIAGFIGFATATQSWMMFAWLTTMFFAAIVMPVTSALMSHRVEPNAQGELQGAVASLFSLSAIVGPPIMAQLFGHFSAPAARPHLPGAAFFASAILTAIAIGVYAYATRQDAPSEVAAIA